MTVGFSIDLRASAFADTWAPRQIELSEGAYERVLQGLLIARVNGIVDEAIAPPYLDSVFVRTDSLESSWHSKRFTALLTDELGVDSGSLYGETFKITARSVGHVVELILLGLDSRREVLLLPAPDLPDFLGLICAQAIPDFPDFHRIVFAVSDLKECKDELSAAHRRWSRPETMSNRRLVSKAYCLALKIHDKLSSDSKPTRSAIKGMYLRMMLCGRTWRQIHLIANALPGTIRTSGDPRTIVSKYYT